MLHIISDSTCDLSPELIERYQIRILPLNVNLGEETYIDGKTITPEELYAWSDRTRQTPKTAVFSETTAMDLFSECLKDGGEIICFAISESMSASAQVMRMAAAELHAEDRVHVVDSANLSTGISLLILLAADLAAEGRPVAEILEIIEKKKPLVRSSFVVDTLTYLHRGG
ncbi:MAG: DegV family EDD domain-containing protein, partial [Clostridia bacterium]|nr:DegV family EDD domain-containing protein [Clostridia bacterium]